MKMRGPAVLECLVAVTLAPQALAQRALTLDELEQQITGVLLNIDAPINRKQKLLELASREEVSAVLLHILERTRNEPRDDKRSTRAAALRSKSISALGEIGEVRAAPLIKSVLYDGSLHSNDRIRAAKALGLIDVQTYKSDLIRVFDEAGPRDWPLRLGLAKSLVPAKDRVILARMEAWSRGEPRPEIRRMFEKVVDDMKRQLGPW